VSVLDIFLLLLKKSKSFQNGYNYKVKQRKHKSSRGCDAKYRARAKANTFETTGFSMVSSDSEEMIAASQQPLLWYDNSQRSDISNSTAYGVHQHSANRQYENLAVGRVGS
jgi:hypothetical protein